MAKFKKGDRVRNLKANQYVPKGAIGIVDEDVWNPFIIWDEVTEYVMNYVRSDKMRWAQEEEYLELIEPYTPTNTEQAIELLKQAIELLSKP